MVLSSGSPAFSACRAHLPRQQDGQQTEENQDHEVDEKHGPQHTPLVRRAGVHTWGPLRTPGRSLRLR